MTKENDLKILFVRALMGPAKTAEQIHEELIGERPRRATVREALRLYKALQADDLKPYIEGVIERIGAGDLVVIMGGDVPDEDHEHNDIRSRAESTPHFMFGSDHPDIIFLASHAQECMASVAERLLKLYHTNSVGRRPRPSLYAKAAVPAL